MGTGNDQVNNGNSSNESGRNHSHGGGHHRFNGNCHYCHKFGHQIKDCHKKQRGEGESANVTNETTAEHVLTITDGNGIWQRVDCRLGCYESHDDYFRRYVV